MHHTVQQRFGLFLSCGWIICCRLEPCKLSGRGRRYEEKLRKLSQGNEILALTLGRDHLN